MPGFTVTRFESTPNPNAVKCWLDRPISDRPRSFLDRAMAEEDALARRLFDEAGAVCLLFNGEWVTVNKDADAEWAAVKEKVRRVLGGEG